MKKMTCNIQLKKISRCRFHSRRDWYIFERESRIGREKMTKRFSCHELIQIVALTSSLNCSLKKTSAATGAAQVAARTAGNANFILKTVETFVLLFVIGFDFKKDERLDALVHSARKSKKLSTLLPIFDRNAEKFLSFARLFEYSTWNLFCLIVPIKILFQT